MEHDKSPEQVPTEPARTRWTPKPEQIIILENIFNSGTVNPAKDETIKIRKILEQYGSVGDANVFYWFQNRRSRSRRRQRQLAAAAASAAASSTSSNNSSGGGGGGGCYLSYSSSSSTSNSVSSLLGEDGCEDDLFSISRQMGFMESTHGQNQYLFSSNSAQSHYEAGQCMHMGIITVFINGIPSEVPRGQFDMRTMFGQDVVLVHSSGELLPSNEYGFLLQGLQMGESYFLVSRNA